MEKIRFAIIGGTGWRAMYYLRVALAMPKQFEVVAVQFRNKQKAEAFEEEYHIPTCLSLEELCEYSFDFAVLSVTKQALPGMLVQLFEKDIPVLAETSIAPDFETAVHVWEKANEFSAKVQVAEQYFLQPMHSAKIKAIQQGLLGEVSSIMLSDAHEYHAVSLMRKYLGTGFQKVRVYGNKHMIPIYDTDSRQGFIRNGERKLSERLRVTLEFEHGAMAFYDFTPAQYRSFIRTRHIQVVGDQGEIFDHQILYLNQEKYPVEQTFVCMQDFHNNNVYSVRLGEQVLYENACIGVRLNEDERAIYDCMIGMKRYLLTGEDIYSLKEALQDAYFGSLIIEAGNNPHTVLSSKEAPWQK